MAKYTLQDLPEKRHVSVPVYVKGIEKLGAASEIFQLYCAMGDRDYDAAVKLARCVIARDPRLKGTQLDAKANRSAQGLGYAMADCGIDAAVTLLEWATHAFEVRNRVSLAGEAYYLLGRCYESECGWHHNKPVPGGGAGGAWSEDHRSMAWAEEMYKKAANNGYAAAYLELSRVYEFKYRYGSRRDGWTAGNPHDADFAAYCALNAVAYGVKGARERYAELKAKGMDGGNLLSVFRASHPNVKI